MRLEKRMCYRVLMFLYSITGLALPPAQPPASEQDGAHQERGHRPQPGA